MNTAERHAIGEAYGERAAAAIARRETFKRYGGGGAEVARNLPADRVAPHVARAFNAEAVRREQRRQAAAEVRAAILGGGYGDE